MGFDGLALRYRAQEPRIERAGDVGRAWIAAGAPMARTVRKLAAQGWGGLQWAEGLPGTSAARYSATLAATAAISRRYWRAPGC